jgi:hypothetical protein
MPLMAKHTMAAKNNANANRVVKMLNSSDHKITKFKVKKVSPARNFESQFHLDEKGNPKVLDGNFYTLSKMEGRDEVIIGKKFISNDYLREIIDGKTFDGLNPQELSGATFEAEGVVLVDEGDEFMPFEAKEAVVAKHGLLLAHSIMIDASITKTDMKQVFLGAMAKKMEEAITPEMVDGYIGQYIS